MTKNELKMAMGTIADAVATMQVYKIKLAKSIEKLYEDDTRKDNYYKERKKVLTDEYNEDMTNLRESIKTELQKVKAHVSTPFEYDPQLSQSVDYLSVMQEMGALSNGMIENEIEKYKGNETALLYLQGKMKLAGIHSRMFDDCMFSTYETDINGQKQFVPPTKYFDELEKIIDSGRDTQIADVLGKTERILGVESAGLENLNADIKQRLDTMEEQRAVVY